MSKLVYRLLIIMLLAGLVPAMAAGQDNVQKESFFLVANLKDVSATVTTDIGPQKTVFKGEMVFSIGRGDVGDATISLTRLNLISKGVPTKSGNSGVIGLSLTGQENKASYDAKKGALSSEFQSRLHYALIDQIKGYIPGDLKEDAVFYSYTEKMSGKLTGAMPPNFDFSSKNSAQINGRLEFKLEEPVLGAVKYCVLNLTAMYERMFGPFIPTEVLRIQPVFIGTGRSDPAATGTAFNTLLAEAVDMWNRCGTERCITIVSNRPRYIDNDDYRVLGGGEAALDDGTSEAYDLMDEVNVVDAVEIFVVERWDPLMDGGGVTFSSGTASAKIVSCDQQLDVPCPAPCAGGGSCGDVNQNHLAHELGHVLGLCHPPGQTCNSGLPRGSAGSVMWASGFCLDNPDSQSANNCRQASNPLLYAGSATCSRSPDIAD